LKTGLNFALTFIDTRGTAEEQESSSLALCFGGHWLLLQIVQYTFEDQYLEEIFQLYKQSTEINRKIEQKVKEQMDTFAASVLPRISHLESKLDQITKIEQKVKEQTDTFAASVLPKISHLESRMDQTAKIEQALDNRIKSVQDQSVDVLSRKLITLEADVSALQQALAKLPVKDTCMKCATSIPQFSLSLGLGAGLRVSSSAVCANGQQLDWNTLNFNSSTAHFTVNAKNISIQQTGYYFVSANVNTTNAGSGNISCIQVDGANVCGSMSSNANGYYNSYFLAAVLRLNAASNVTVYYAGNANTHADQYANQFSIVNASDSCMCSLLLTAHFSWFLSLGPSRQYKCTSCQLFHRSSKRGLH
jgi:hypothetical protein